MDFLEILPILSLLNYFFSDAFFQEDNLQDEHRYQAPRPASEATRPASEAIKC